MSADQEKETIEEQAETEAEEQAVETQVDTNAKQDPVRWLTLFVLIFWINLQ